MFESLGLQLVADLADQLDGSLTIGPAPVARFSLRFRPAGPPPGADPAWRPAGISAPNGPIMRAPIA